MLMGLGDFVDSFHHLHRTAPVNTLLCKTLAEYVVLCSASGHFFSELVAKTYLMADSYWGCYTWISAMQQAGSIVLV